MSETTWLTYAEMAKAMGITSASAKRLAIRRGWPKKPGNDGQALVCVPNERLQPPAKTQVHVTSDDASDNTGVVTGAITPAVVAVLTRHVERLEAELAAVKAERDAERQAAADLALKAAQVEALRELIEAERRRAVDLEGERDRLLAAFKEKAASGGLFSRLRRAFG